MIAPAQTARFAGFTDPAFAERVYLILRGAPYLMKFLSIAGTAAMFLVGGSLLVHGIAPLHHFIELQGERWGARRDVMHRAGYALDQLIETASEHAEPAHRAPGGMRRDIPSQPSQLGAARSSSGGLMRRDTSPPAQAPQPMPAPSGGMSLRERLLKPNAPR